MKVFMKPRGYKRVALSLFTMIILIAGQATPLTSREDKTIFRWDNLRLTGRMDGQKFNNGFGTLRVNPQGLEHEGFHTVLISWDRIRSFRLAQLENLISIELSRDKDKCDLTTLAAGYSRFQFERIHRHLERLHRRYVE